MSESYCYDRNCYANFLEWKEDYVKYLKSAYHNGTDKYKNISIYQDPDSKGSYSLIYYRKLARFLNQRERVFFDKKLFDDKEFVYEADNYEDKGVLILVKSKDGKALFYLQSDQFGFSAPSGSFVKRGKKHIYDVYLELSKDENKEENVAKWIWESRTIGGSFLWPLEKRENRNPAYNMARGNYYLQDRCDLTLAEIRGYYEKDIRTIGEEKRNYLYNKIRNRENQNLSRWLEHFGDFDTYVKYFCMEDFVETIDDKENNKRFRPINLYSFPEQKNIIDERYMHEDIYDKTKDEKKYYINICNMLNILCKKIIARSKKMEKIIAE